MPQEVTNGLERGSLAQEGRGSGMAEHMRPPVRRRDPRRPDSFADQRVHGGVGQGTGGGVTPSEDPSVGADGASVSKIGHKRRGDRLEEREQERAAHLRLGDTQDGPSPLDVVKTEFHDFTRAQSVGRQKLEDGVVTSPARGGAVGAGEHQLDVRRGERPRQMRQGVLSAPRQSRGRKGRQVLGIRPVVRSKSKNDSMADTMIC